MGGGEGGGEGGSIEFQPLKNPLKMKRWMMAMVSDVSAIQRAHPIIPLDLIDETKDYL